MSSPHVPFDRAVSTGSSSHARVRFRGLDLVRRGARSRTRQSLAGTGEHRRAPVLAAAEAGQYADVGAPSGGADRPVALVMCPATPLVAALAVALLERGYEVHLPRDVLAHPFMASDRARESLLHGWRNLRSVDATTSSTAGRAALLASVVRTGRPLTVAVLTVGHRGRGDLWSPDATFAATRALLTSSGGAGRLMLVPTFPPSWSAVRRAVRAVGPGVSVTVLAPTRPPRERARPRGRDQRTTSYLDDASAVARAGVDAMLAGRKRAATAGRWHLQSGLMV